MRNVDRIRSKLTGAARLEQLDDRTFDLTGAHVDRVDTDAPAALADDGDARRVAVAESAAQALFGHYAEERDARRRQQEERARLDRDAQPAHVVGGEPAADATLRADGAAAVRSVQDDAAKATSAVDANLATHSDAIDRMKDGTLDHRSGTAARGCSGVREADRGHDRRHAGRRDDGLGSRSGAGLRGGRHDDRHRYRRAEENLEAMLQVFEKIADERPTLDGKLPPEVIVRFGHATHATPAQAERMARLGIIAEVNLTSNIQTGSVLQGPPDRERGSNELFPPHEANPRHHDGKLDDHSLPSLIASGVQIILNTDAHSVMSTDMADQYQRAYEVIEAVRDNRREVALSAQQVDKLGIAAPDGKVYYRQMNAALKKRFDDRIPTCSGTRTSTTAIAPSSRSLPMMSPANPPRRAHHREPHCGRFDRLESSPLYVDARSPRPRGRAARRALRRAPRRRMPAAARPAMWRCAAAAASRERGPRARSAPGDAGRAE